MTRLTLTALLLTLLVSIGCSTPSMTSNILANPAYDLATMKTYAWPDKQALTMIGVLVGSSTQPMENAIKEIFGETMAKKGYRNVKLSEDPDFVVMFAAGAVDQMSMSVHSVEGNRLSRNQYVWTQMNDTLQGGLAITFLDPVSEANMWQGTAGDRVKPRESNKDDNITIKRLINEILKNLPAAR